MLALTNLRPRAQLHLLRNNQLESRQQLNQAMQNDAPRQGNWKAGTGRGNKRSAESKMQCEVESPTKEARVLLSTDRKDVPKLRVALSSLCKYASSLKRKLGILGSKSASLSRLLAATNSGIADEGSKGAHHRLTRELAGKEASTHCPTINSKQNNRRSSTTVSYCSTRDGSWCGVRIRARAICGAQGYQRAV